MSLNNNCLGSGVVSCGILTTITLVASDYTELATKLE